jgi:hypothetical protein
MIHAWQVSWADDSGSVVRAYTYTVTEGRLTLDENWAPYIQAEVMFPIAGLVGVDFLDPRTDVRVNLTLTMTALGASAAAASRSFNLGVRTREVDWLAGTVTLTLASDEALMQDYRDLQHAAAVYGFGKLIYMVPAVIQTVLPAATVTFPTTLRPADNAAISDVVYGTSTLWDVLAPWVTRAARRVWCDGARGWHYDDPATNLTASPMLLSVTDNLTSAVETLDRTGDWYDALGITYKLGDVTYLAFRTPAGYTRAGALERETTEFVDYAEIDTSLAASSHAGRQFPITAVSDITAQPGLPITLDRGIGAELTGYISAVTFDCATDEMTIRPRDLEES